jgi:2,3-diaminopropionate biosynthesis protein SbnB
MLIIRHAEVREILDEREREIADLVATAYRLHDAGRSAVPHSTFLRFPDRPRDRIIALPAYLGGEMCVAGVKWVASFPENIDAGLARASATIVLNSLRTGYPEAFIEASLISAKRTAASAALAASVLTGPQAGEPFGPGVGLIGCGVINAEVLRFLAAMLPALSTATIFDTDAARVAEFAQRCAETVPKVGLTVADSADEVLSAHSVTAIATTAARPHLDLAACRPGSTVLHISLRDLTASSILISQNVVDDPDHVCREQTSLHLAEELSGDRAFITASIGGILRDPASFRRDPAGIVVFSPFGLGILDIALARFVLTEAVRARLGVHIDDFLPQAPQANTNRRRTEEFSPMTGC